MSQKNPKKNENLVFDIKPAERPVVLDLESQKYENLLLEALIENENEFIEKQHYDLAKNKSNQKAIKNLISPKSLNLDQTFEIDQIPSRINLNNKRNKLEFNSKPRFENENFSSLAKPRIVERKTLIQEKSKNLQANETKKQIKEEKLAKISEKLKNKKAQENLVRFQKKEESKKTKEQQRKIRERKINQIKKNLSAKPSQNYSEFNFFKSALAFSGIGLVIFLFIFSTRFVSYGFQIKEDVVVKGTSVVADLDKIKNSFQDKDFSQIVSDLEKIQKDINAINENLEQMEGGLPDLINRLPFVSKYGSAKNLLEAGNEITKALILTGELAEKFALLENPLDFKENNYSTGDFFLNLEKQSSQIEKHLKIANEKIDLVDPEDLPEDYQKQIADLKQRFPQVLDFLSQFNQKQAILKDLLGYNGPRKYLFLFQNNQEIRATGGFIGSYGVLKVHNGNIEDLFVDGIFNPDGQLYTKVVPPKPIQKISTAWSTHDANWFPNFPDSAKKIAWFYEKTGGPTVDGIITLTPTVMKKFLEITGPIEMNEYEVTVDADNFVEATQSEVELEYDREENKPKKFIADLTPKIFQELFSQESLSDFPRILQTLSGALQEKHLLVYLQNAEIQKTVSELGWSGEVLKAPKDYLMVVNSNINGYKTDGVVDQEIKHEIEIGTDGSIIDTVIIERFHNGGSSQYEWWNKVNANYLRVYVPQGSELLEAEGYTRETVEPPVDYDKLGFLRDDLVTKLEDSIKIDEKTGTEIWNEAGKTVFGNWVYVSPQEKVKVVYKYKLPFKIEINRKNDKMDNYSILYQKQSGMETSKLESRMNLTDQQDIFWKYPEDLVDEDGVLERQTNLEKDRFWGVVIK